MNPSELQSHAAVVPLVPTRPRRASRHVAAPARSARPLVVHRARRRFQRISWQEALRAFYSTKRCSTGLEILCCNTFGNERAQEPARRAKTGATPAPNECRR